MWRFLVIILSFAAFAHEISSWTFEGKFHISARSTYSLFVSLLSNQYFLPMQQQLYETSRPNLLSQAVLYYVKHCRRKQHVEYRSIFLSRIRSTKIQGVNKKAKKKKKTKRIAEKERCFTCMFEGLELTWGNDPVVFYNVTSTKSFVVIESHNTAQKYFKEGTTGEVPLRKTRSFPS